jgi:2-hydroxychromene-2-carboxylate isomerase
MLRHQQRRPWSLTDEREAGIAEIAARAAARGLPPLRYPPDWPVGSYSLMPLRVVLALPPSEQPQASRALYRAQWVDGLALREPESIAAAGLDPALAESEEAKQRLVEITEDVNARGVFGVPSVLVGDEIFWGDDRLEDAAAAIAG